jgi:hypothetical protein
VLRGLGLGCSIQNRRVVDPIAFVWKGLGMAGMVGLEWFWG